jgi:hypothetical protein
MQSGSFLAGQRHLRQAKGKSNAETVFKMERIPTDTHIRNLLDPVSPSELSDEFRYLLAQMAASGYLKQWYVLGKRLAFSLDGVYYFSSQKISCPQCQRQERENGVVYLHSAITPVVVAPGHPTCCLTYRSLSVPQDGVEKQDCEVNAAKRWVQQEQAVLSIVIRRCCWAMTSTASSLCVKWCWPAAVILSLSAIGTPSGPLRRGGCGRQFGSLADLTRRHWNGSHGEIWTYRFLNDVLLRSGDDALSVNWCDLLVTHEETGEVLYRNEWVTSLALDETNTPDVVACGRARWKSENENNNVLKHHGYHIAHNFGHGLEHLSTTLLTLNLLAFLLHTIAQVADEVYQQIRQALGKRSTFFNDVEALMRYLIFSDWQSLLKFMFVQLELEPD